MYAQERQKRQAEIVRCDVVIVGGGIAGVACAERLTREARRQGILLRVVVVEREKELGSQSSAGLEGWYHSGGLYSASDDTRFMTHCLASMEDLHNWYRLDPEFLPSAQEHCNLMEITADNPRPQYKFDKDSAKRWFVGEITYLMPFHGINEMTRTVRTAGTEWRRATGQAKALITRLFYKCNWTSKYFPGWCQTPHIGAQGVLDHSDPRDIQFLEEASKLRFRDVLGISLSGQSRQAALEELDERERELGKVVQGMNDQREENEGTLDIMTSRDAVMNTRLILSDLVESAANNGTKFLMEHELLHDSVQVSRISGKVRGIRVRDMAKDRVKQIIADQYVFALGFGFEEGELLRRRLNVPVRIEKSVSVMAVEEPGFGKHSFVCMDPFEKNNFNHIYHPKAAATDLPDGYSIIADSNRLSEDCNDDGCAETAMVLIEKAEKVFPADGEKRRLGWYGCPKTEFFSLEETQRNYSWRMEPRIDKMLVTPHWSDKRERQWEAQDEIQQLVIKCCDQPEVCAAIQMVTEHLKASVQATKKHQPQPEFPSVDKGIERLASDGWALNKALHFALQQLVWSKGKDNAERAKTTFECLRALLVAAFEQQIVARHAVMPNYVCIVPGKFSHFATLSHNIYLEMEGRGLFQAITTPETGQDFGSESPPVAPPKGEALLKDAEYWGW